jgi:hypothetical protein
MTEGNSPGKDCQAAVADGTAGNNCRLTWQHNQTTSIKLYYENGAPKFRKIFPYLGKRMKFLASRDYKHPSLTWWQRATRVSCELI